MPRSTFRHHVPLVRSVLLYLWSRGVASKIVRSDDQLAGVGTILQMGQPALVFPTPQPDFPLTAFVGSNEAGQVVTTATLTDGTGVMLLASPPFARMPRAMPGR
jgi:hypothetical protein